ncbi:MAG: ROK family protein [Phycisphaerales bacterium]|jgi:hypothetical protein|nr:ROK family protein [Phycisphaerales bacterium]MBT7170310.1 ROK family protein [Phycisphaerales bacterium]
MANEKTVYIGLELHVTRGCRIALFEDIHTVLAQSLLRRDDDREFGQFVDALAEAIEVLLVEQGITTKNVRALGIAAPGILGRDGEFQLVEFLADFQGCNLKTALADRLNLVVDIENDASCGALAEWSIRRVETLYWNFSEGWGGAWVGRDGQIRYTAHGWDGRDSSLHYTCEPGYAIPLSKLDLQMMFNEVNASYARFEQLLVDEFQTPDGMIHGPNQDPETIRAELALSNHGRCRLFRAIVGDDHFYERFLDDYEVRQMGDPDSASVSITKLARKRVEAAVDTDRLFGRILAKATSTLMHQAARDGIGETVPICIGGDVTAAIASFGPSAQRAMAKVGLKNYLRPSVIEERGDNPVLMGAAVLAEHAWHRANKD